MASAILRGDGDAAVEITSQAMASDINIDDVVMDGILKAWDDFRKWLEKDPNESLRSWFDCFNATYRIIKFIESKITPPPDPRFSVLVATVKGEGHVLMRDIIALLVKSKGIKVYSFKKGVSIEDLNEPFSDPSLKFVILSCIESRTKEKVQNLIKGIKDKKPELKIIAGGLLAESVGADLVISEPSAIYGTLLELAKKSK